MLRADKDGQMVFVPNEFLLYFFKCKWNRQTGHLLTKISNFVNSITRSTYCNARSTCCNIMMQR